MKFLTIRNASRSTALALATLCVVLSLSAGGSSDSSVSGVGPVDTETQDSSGLPRSPAVQTSTSDAGVLAVDDSQIESYQLGEEEIADPRGEEPVPWIISLATQTSRGVANTDIGGALLPSSSGGWRFFAGDRATMSVGSGMPFPNLPADQWPSILCGGYAIGNLPDPSMIPDTAHRWTAEILATTTLPDAVELEVQWAHERMNGQGGYDRIAGDTRTLRLKHGDRHPLELLESSTPATDCGRHLLLEIRAERSPESREVAYDLLGLELWFQHEGRDGTRSLRHAQAIVRQGEPFEFIVDGVRQPMALPFSDGTVVEAVVEVIPTVTGWVRADGSVEIDIEAHRWYGAAELGARRVGGIGDRGQRRFFMEPGETVEMVLPQPTQRVAVHTIHREVGGEMEDAEMGVAETWDDTIDTLFLRAKRVR